MSEAPGFSRAEFMSRGVKGGLALVAGGSILAVTAKRALASPSAASARSADADIAKLAATAELLAIDFYSKAIMSRKFQGDERRYLTQARANEVAHYDALAQVLGSAAPKDLAFKYPAGTFGSRKSIANTGVALETAFVGAYLGAVTALESNDLKGVAASIGTNEASHLSVFSDIAKNQPVLPAFPKALTADQATAAVGPFLG